MNIYSMSFLLRWPKHVKGLLILLHQQGRRLFCRRIEYRDVTIGNASLVSFEYFGWRIYCSRDTALLDRLKYTSDVYEKDEVKALQKEIARTSALCVLDVGANIGLISFPLLRLFPGLTIHAFEPGPVQNHFLEISIARNQIADRLHLNKVALADYTGEVDFHVHGSRDASGDGMHDTGRAGTTVIIKAPVMRMDDWWQASNRPKIDLIKIDVEGGEMLVLKGGCELLRSCRPVISLEISNLNLMPYSYSANDVFDWLDAEKYRLYTLQGQAIARDVFFKYLNKQDSFVARPH